MNIEKKVADARRFLGVQRKRIMECLQPLEGKPTRNRQLLRVVSTTRGYLVEETQTGGVPLFLFEIGWDGQSFFYRDNPTAELGVQVGGLDGMSDFAVQKLLGVLP